VGKRFEYFLATGNLVSQSGLDIKQTTGFCIIAEKLNYMRYIAHFRCVHRGQFFAEMRTTSVRKLLPDSWGFMCPVHTPDGAPCGLLNHFTAPCRITDVDDIIGKENEFIEKLTSFGMVSVRTGVISLPSDYLSVVWNGRVLGTIPEKQVLDFIDRLRGAKISKNNIVPETLEIAFTQIIYSQYPAVYLFSGPARMVRPVVNIKYNDIELIGTFEQPFLSIALSKEESKVHHTHHEVSKINIFSILAASTPYSDFNQSPRNMYQCQMLKQTMGTPMHSYPYRFDNKLFRIYTPQSPVVKNLYHDKYGFDDYLTGTNAVVAVLAYTGY
jgi:DNA-directed RNA polymerase I subunit RPA2